MLMEFLGSDNFTKSFGEQEYLLKTIEAVDACVDFLRDNNLFPNIEINEVTTLLWRQMGNREIPLMLNPMAPPTIQFVVVTDSTDVETIPFISGPLELLDRIQADPIDFLARIASVGSQARDFYSGRLKESTQDKVNKRAEAYGAEVFLTLAQMARSEGVELSWTTTQLKLLQKYPLGLKSLPSGYMYPTPVYNTGIGNAHLQ